IIGGRTMLPMRVIFDALGATVAWDQATQTATAERGGRTVRLTVGDRTAQVGGTWVTLDVPPVLVGGRILVPLRFVSEAFGAHVQWDPASRTVTIISAVSGGGAAGTGTATGGLPAGAVEVVGPVPASVSASVRAELPGLWARIADALGVPADLREVPRVVLLGDRDLYRQRLVQDGTPALTAERIAAQAAGSASADTVHVGADSEATDPLGTLAFDLAYAALIRLGLDQAMPDWLGLGLAEYIGRSAVEGQRWTPRGSRYWAVVHREVLDAAAAGQLRNVFEEDAESGQWLGDYSAYAQALLAVTLLADRWGEQAITAYLHALRAGTLHPQAFQSAFKMPVEEFQGLFRSHLTQQARVDTGRVRVVLELPEAVTGYLTVFAPGTRRTFSWRLSGSGQISVLYEPGRGVTVGGAVRSDADHSWTLEEIPQELLVYMIPDEPLHIADMQVEQVGLAFSALYGYWYWAGTWVTLTDGSAQDITDPDDPALGGFLRLLEVRTL
ncbi:MAG TPA: copper amine oxidase N-terminal domain-containing protein, partial [Bacillota bacterium]